MRETVHGKALTVETLASASLTTATLAGLTEVLRDAITAAARPLSPERLFGWHRMLSVSGAPALRDLDRSPDELEQFIDWVESGDLPDPLITAGLALRWFAGLAPFAAGNGRMARAIASLILVRSEAGGGLAYSLSAEMAQSPQEYRRLLAAGPDITDWLHWFLRRLLAAIESAGTRLTPVLLRAGFWERFASEPLNARQILVLNRLLDGIEGKLTTSRWARLAGCSQDTAQRDIAALIERGAMQKNAAGGRSTSYSLRVRLPA